ncbi:MAG TPA: ASCH domain-containing protein [Candidatus Nanoarchaeia archaeon]|nr:ASCH domain-containing protein [Candidatus Nanoarchaeia archaeon]
MKKTSHWKFGYTKKETDKLVNLVVKGKKRATSSLYDSYVYKKRLLPKIGDRVVIKDSKNRAGCLIAITKVNVKPFGRISPVFAAKEGEGDLSL